MTLYPVFSRRVMRQLEHKGFTVVKILPNTKFPDKNVYYFEETVELRQAVNHLTTKTNNTHSIGCDSNDTGEEGNSPHK